MRKRAALAFIGSIIFFSGSSFGGFENKAVQIRSGDGTQLTGILTIPTQSSPVTKAALLLQGSGNVGADGDVSGPFLGHGRGGHAAKLSEEMAEALAEHGIASLRFAKRGVENSKLLPQQAFPYLVDDAQAAFDLLAEKMPDARRAIVGFSEGGLVATILAARLKTEAPLFLLAPATRSIDDLLAYQFLSWPLELLRAKIEWDYDGVLSNEELSRKDGFTLPFLGQGFAGLNPFALDANHDGALTLTTEVVPAYQKLHANILQVVKSPDFAPWYDSLKALAPFSTYASAVSSKAVYAYQGMNDAQMHWSFVASDVLAFGQRLKATRLYPELGHCFSQMEGTIGEVKTSGPFEAPLLKDLVDDVSLELN